MTETEHNPEKYTLSIEKLLEIYMDGMMSGMTTTLLNSSDLSPDEGRNMAGYQLFLMSQDPALVETCRDIIRTRINGGTWERHLLKIHLPEDL